MASKQQFFRAVQSHARNISGNTKSTLDVANAKVCASFFPSNCAQTQLGLQPGFGLVAAGLLLNPLSTRVLNRDDLQARSVYPCLEKSQSPSRFSSAPFGIPSQFGSRSFSSTPFVPAGESDSKPPGAIQELFDATKDTSIPADTLTSDSLTAPTTMLQSWDLSLISSSSEVAAFAGDSYKPIQGMMYLLENIHDFTGLPWWMTVAAATVMLRSCMFPIAVMTVKNTAKLTLARPEMEEFNEKMKADLAGKEGQDLINAQMGFQKKMMDLYAKYDCNPLKSVAPILIQGPMFITFFLSLDKMSQNCASFKTGGIAPLFLDLSTPDPFCIMPLATSAIFLLTVELGAMENMEGNPYAAQLKWGMRGLSVVLVPLTMHFAKGVMVYWIANNTFSFCQGMVLKQKPVKRFFGIPDTAHLQKEAMMKAVENISAAHAKWKEISEIKQPKFLDASSRSKKKKGGKRS